MNNSFLNLRLTSLMLSTLDVIAPKDRMKKSFMSKVTYEY